MRTGCRIEGDDHRSVRDRKGHHGHEAPIVSAREGQRRQGHQDPESASRGPSAAALPQPAAGPARAASAFPCCVAGAAGNGVASAQQEPMPAASPAAGNEPTRHLCLERRSGRSAAAADDGGGAPLGAVAGNGDPAAAAATGNAGAAVSTVDVLRAEVVAPTADIVPEPAAMPVVTSTATATVTATVTATATVTQRASARDTTVPITGGAAKDKARAHSAVHGEGGGGSGGSGGFGVASGGALRNEGNAGIAGEGCTGEEACEARGVEQEQQQPGDGSFGAKPGALHKELCRQEPQQERRGEQERETTVMLPDAGARRDGRSGDARDELDDGVGASACMPVADTDMVAAGGPCVEPTSRGEVAATAAGRGTVAPNTGAATATGTGTAEASSVWDLDSLDFEEEGEEEQGESDGRREMEPAQQREHQGEKEQEQEQEQEEEQERVQRAENVDMDTDKDVDMDGVIRPEEYREPTATANAAAANAAAPRAAAPAVKQSTTPTTIEGGSDKRASSCVPAVGCGVPVVTVVHAGPPCDRARELMPPPPPNIGRAKMRRRRSRVTLMHSPRYQRLCGLLERHSRRDDLLYAMLGACDLPERLTIVAPARATDVHLRAYHDRDYVEALRNPPSDVRALDEYGLLEDCEVFEELYDYCCAVAGASLHAADRLCRGEADVAINWGGGRHHAKKGEAAGFCYVNDGVLAVLHLAKAFGTVLTIDIDVHHGDGVQEAFYLSNKVMTMSFHHLAKGFFPGAGQCSETGAGNGRDFNLNIPLKEGCGDESFLRVFSSALEAVTEGFRPEAVVLLCGADTLSADPLGPFNLTSEGVRSCVELVVALGLPLLLLGGGGYCPTDTARLWTSLTAAAVGTDAVAALPSTVPDHAYFPLYGPDFRMATREKKTLPDRNDGVFLTRLCDFAGQSGRRVRASANNAARKKRQHASTGFQGFSYTGSSDSW